MFNTKILDLKTLNGDEGLVVLRDFQNGKVKFNPNKQKGSDIRSISKRNGYRLAGAKQPVFVDLTTSDARGQIYMNGRYQQEYNRTQDSKKRNGDIR